MAVVVASVEPVAMASMSLGPARPVASAVVPVGSVVIILIPVTPVKPVCRTGSGEKVRSFSSLSVCFQAASAVHGSNFSGQRSEFIQRVCSTMNQFKLL